MRSLFAVLLILLLTACASSRGFDRGTLREQLSGQQQVTEDEIKKVLELKPQLPAPFRLAVYFTPPAADWRYGQSWYWTGEDKETLLEFGTALKNKGVISDLVPLGGYLVEGGDNKAIRLAAARAGADAVLVVNGSSDVDRYNNELGLTYLLLVTPFFVAGSEADALFLANATLWDVRNQYLYLAVEGEGTAKEVKPAYYINEKRLVNEARTAALANLKGELLTRLARVGGK